MFYLVTQMGIILAVAAIAFFALGGWYATGRERRRLADLPQEVEQPKGNPELAAAEVAIGKYQDQIAAFEADLSKARAHISPNEEAAPAAALPGGEEDPELGLIYPVRPEVADDLTAIRGVGKVVARDLNDLGVYTLAQIANWDRERVVAFSASMGFKDRIRRDDWVGQAARLG
jgi:predicted flap endonuclease-1-like 5' DNA nuclease